MRRRSRVSEALLAPLSRSFSCAGHLLRIGGTNGDTPAPSLPKIAGVLPAIHRALSRTKPEGAMLFSCCSELLVAGRKRLIGLSRLAAPSSTDFNKRTNRYCKKRRCPSRFYWRSHQDSNLQPTE